MKNYTIEEAAALMGTSKSFLYRELRRGYITYEQYGRRKFIPQESLEQYRQAHRLCLKSG